MKRRKFIKRVAAGGAVPFALNGVPLQMLAAEKPLSRLSAASTNDRVLVILQMHGGNDTVNTFVPLDNYDLYYNRRANIALPYRSGKRTVITLDSTLPEEKQIGVHPDMIDFKSLYDRGRAAVVQGVSYENNNGSHFRGRDIWYMGGGSEDYFTSGWAGRYLNSIYAPQTYPEDFPNEEMPDPLALEMGNDVSLLFHQDESIPTAIALGNNPSGLAQLIDSLDGYQDQGIDPRGLPPEFLSNTPYGKEMNWILGLEEKSEDYIKRLQQVYENSSGTSIDYPERYTFSNSRNPLSGQLQLVARLLDGGGEGVKTKIFLLKIGGFDTHAQQVENYDPTLGSHAALLNHISSAMHAFQKDLAARGLEDRVLTVTMSEFGRRIGSNGSYGTDHGTGGAVMVFGKYVNPGVFGDNPDLSQNNISMRYDYRHVYASILRDWLQVDEDTIREDIFFGDFLNTDIKLSVDELLGAKPFVEARFQVDDIYPNPAENQFTLSYRHNDNHEASAEVFDQGGSLILRKNIRNPYGQHQVSFDIRGLNPGVYHVKFSSEKLNRTQKLIIR